MLSVADVQARVDDIRASAGDPEEAHGMEGVLLADVLREIADGHPAPRELARAALATFELDFPRWCA